MRFTTTDKSKKRRGEVYTPVRIILRGKGLEVVRIVFVMNQNRAHIISKLSEVFTYYLSFDEIFNEYLS